MKNRNLLILGAVLAVAAAVVLLYPRQQKNNFAGKLDTFAQCLADKKVTMYGADWCPHCQNEKKAFGDSFRLVPYVECPDNPKACLDAGVSRYPTWIFPEGKKLEGELGLEKLSQESGCALPEVN